MTASKMNYLLSKDDMTNLDDSILDDDDDVDESECGDRVLTWWIHSKDAASSTSGPVLYKCYLIVPFCPDILWSVLKLSFKFDPGLTVGWLVSFARTHTRWISPRINTLIRLDDKVLSTTTSWLYRVMFFQALSSVKFSVCPPPQCALQFFSVFCIQLV